MNAETELLQYGRIRVTNSTVRTRRLTVALDDVDLVELRRPLLGPAILLAIACSALALRFSNVLLANEIAVLVGAGLVLATISFCIARLTLHSYSIDDVALLLPIWRARRVRSAIDQALAMRQEHCVPRQRRTT